MPIEASCVSDFTMSGKFSRFGRWTARPTRKTTELGHRNAMVGEQHLRERLVPRQHQAPRVAAGVGLPQQLEVADDVLVEDRHFVEVLEHVEGDVRVEVAHRRADDAQVVLDAEDPHLVAHVPERRDDVVLGLPVDGQQVVVRHVLGRDQVVMDERQHAQFSHSATRWRPLCR